MNMDRNKTATTGLSGERLRIALGVWRVEPGSVIQTNDPGRAQMRAVAIKKSSREQAGGFREMGTLRCDGCGEEFLLAHDPTSGDMLVAEKHARWLERVLGEEHERDKKHPDRIELPD